MLRESCVFISARTSTSMRELMFARTCTPFACPFVLRCNPHALLPHDRMHDQTRAYMCVQVEEQVMAPKKRKASQSSSSSPAKKKTGAKAAMAADGGVVRQDSPGCGAREDEEMPPYAALKKTYLVTEAQMKAYKLEYHHHQALEITLTREEENVGDDHTVQSGVFTTW